MRIRTLAMTAALLLGQPVVAHDEPADRIHTLNRRIAADPGNPDLYLERGELLRVTRRWDAALLDYDRAIGLDPTLTAMLDVRRAQVQLGANRPTAALHAAESALAARPNDAAATLARARALRALDRHDEALRGYADTLRRLETRRPEHYLEYAAAVVAADADRAADAAAIIETGIAELGSIVTLELAALDLEVDAGDTDAALVRLERMTERSRRPERWLLRRGRVLETAGRCDDAAIAYAAAVNAIELLPPRHRFTPATRDLATEAREALSALRDEEPRSWSSIGGSD